MSLGPDSLEPGRLTSDELRQGRPILWTRTTDSEPFFIRPVLPEDKPLFDRGLEHLSMQSRQFRFLSGISRFSTDQLKFLTEVDQELHVCWVAVMQDASAGVGVARLSRLPEDPTAAEMAITVVDDWQSRGVGRQLLGVLVATALARGIEHFEAEVAPDNRKMLGWLNKLGSTPMSDTRHRLPLDRPLAADLLASG